MKPYDPAKGPMLARLSRELPIGDYFYEPKWDGFRCLAFAGQGALDLRSRNHKPLARYFPELVEAFAGIEAVVDGEIVIARPGGFDFAALLGRVHPAASRVERLRREAPATFIAFDLLAQGGEDLCERPFSERRDRLEKLGLREPLQVTRATRDAAVASEWLRTFQGGGIDGVVAKAADLRYQPGRRAMIKVKREHTLDCVVAGLRLFDDCTVSSLLLGLYDGEELRHVGVVTSFSGRRRKELFEELRPLFTPLEGHPWERGFGLGHSPIGRLAGSAGRWDPKEMSQDWLPLRPEVVCEVAYDQVDAGRFRHGARFRRFRPDRDARSCTFDQLAPKHEIALGA